MSKITILASGSQGNAALYQAGGTNLLIDAGISARQLAVRLLIAGVSPQDIHAILVTHEHSDHVRGLDVWSKQYNTPVFANEATGRKLCEASSRVQLVSFDTGEYFNISGITIDPIPIRHDAVDPVGFMLYHENTFTALVTDTGSLNERAMSRLADVDTFCIESNYCPALLGEDQTRPTSIHSRVAGRNGHLSNAECARIIAALPRLRSVTLCHLSRSCNTPELALESATRALEGRDVVITVAKP